jgi:SAM-dependent methyltransferase
MSNHYQDPQIAIKYLNFLNSPNGQIQKLVLLNAIKTALPNDPNLKLLDLGCGNGWLAAELYKSYKNICGCDSSEFLINFARTHSKGVDFKLAALDKPLPYKENYFDIVILNMVGPDLGNLAVAFKNTAFVLKPGGKLIMTVPNPKYTYPAAEWKRNALDVLLMRKPKLKTKIPPEAGTKIQREFGKNSKIDSYYHTLDGYVAAAAKAELKLNEIKEIQPHSNSKKFDLNYQLQKYPLLLLLELEKIG